MSAAIRGSDEDAAVGEDMAQQLNLPANSLSHLCQREREIRPISLRNKCRKREKVKEKSRKKNDVDKQNVSM